MPSPATTRRPAHSHARLLVTFLLVTLYVASAPPDGLVPTGFDESREPLKTILERGYRAGRVYETQAQGQRAFLVLFSRPGPPKDAGAGGRIEKR